VSFGTRSNGKLARYDIDHTQIPAGEKADWKVSYDLRHQRPLRVKALVEGIDGPVVLRMLEDRSGDKDGNFMGRVEKGGLVYYVACPAGRWPFHKDALGGRWEQVGDPEPSRRAKAASRRAAYTRVELDALDALVLAELREIYENRSYTRSDSSAGLVAYEVRPYAVLSETGEPASPGMVKAMDTGGTYKEVSTKWEATVRGSLERLAKRGDVLRFADQRPITYMIAE